MHADPLPFRFDLQVVKLEQEGDSLQVLMIPNPARYEWQIDANGRYLYDKMDNLAFSEDVVKRLLEWKAGTPLYAQGSYIEDVDQYVESRYAPAFAMLQGLTDRGGFEDLSAEFLSSRTDDRLEFVALCVDIVGSTMLATSMSQKSYRRMIKTCLHELSRVVPLYRGYVLKYTGDGLICYFPAPSFLSKNDLAIACAVTMIRIVNGPVNSALESKGMRRLSIRVGLDAGESFIETIGSSATKSHKDIVGPVISLAAKIQTKAQPGGICLGDVAERNLHTSWREYCEPVDLGADWQYAGSDGRIYRVHRVKNLP